MNQIGEWLQQTANWLDGKGRLAWIATMVIAFIIAWPIGLAILGFMIWSGRMGCQKSKWSRRMKARATGNTAFDDYREDTLRRLEEEQGAFEGFLEQLRRAKDKAEFDQFMSERNRPINDGPISA